METVIKNSSPQKITIAGDGSGDFNCDGKDDHVQINQALAAAKGATVHLKGHFTYVINDSLLIGSNTTLEGDSTAVIKLKDQAYWPAEKPLIKQKLAKESTKGRIIIRGFEINGNADGNTKPGKEMRGDGFDNLMMIYYDDIEVCNMYLHDSLGDGLRVKYSQNVKFHDNKINMLGHDGLYAIKCKNVEAWNNTVRCKTNSALRIYNTNKVKLHDNTIYTVFEPDAGGPGIQIQYIREDTPFPMNSIEVYNNTIYDTYGPGIWLIAYGKAYSKDEAKNVHIHHNKFTGCGTHPKYDWVCGIETSGFYDTLIENNVFDGNYHAGVALQAALGIKPPGTGYVTTVRNNKIINTKQRKYKPEGTGKAVVNYLTGTHSFILENNTFANNVGDPASVITPSTITSSDNRLREATPDTVYKCVEYIDIGGLTSRKYRGLLWFDLKNTPITKATLSLYWYYPAGKPRKNDTIIEVYRPAFVWNSNSVSWNKRDKDTAWSNAGGNWYDKNNVLQGGTPYTAITLKASSLPDNKYCELNVTNLVKEYVSGKYTNTGFLIKARNESDNYIAFYGSGCGVEGKKPKLVRV